ncbi:hypothetical protein TNCV_1700321 [Trichonephila clavipes]|nr:hypothetical protein TNCV_1700321 [Trichonephila clavipes]
MKIDIFTELHVFVDASKGSYGNPELVEMVLIGNDNKKRLSWPVAKIIELIPGRDGEIRTVRPKNSTWKEVIRPVQRIFPLEVQAIANSDKGVEEESVSVKVLNLKRS